MIKRGLTLVAAMHITASVFINDDESGLHHDYEVWLEKVCSRLHPAPHAPIDQAGPEAADPLVGCTTAPAKLANGKPLSRKERGNNADAHLKRHGPPSAAVVAVTNGRIYGSTERSTEGFGRAQPRASRQGLAKVVGTRERILGVSWVADT